MNEPEGAARALWSSAAIMESMRHAMHPRHTSPRSRVLTIALPIGLAVTALGALWALTEVPSVAEEMVLPAPVVVAHLPGIEFAAVDAVDPCAIPEVTAALAAGDDE